MYAVTFRQYLARTDAWKRAPREQRKQVTTRDEWGRPCKELWAFGKCYTRIVDVGGGFCELYADRGGRVERKTGPIAFSQWDEPEFVHGDGKPHRMPMVPRRL